MQGKDGVQVDIRKLNGKTQDADQAAQRVVELLDRLGGAGKIKILRILENGDECYAATVEVDESLYEDLEERIAALVGGGRYKLQGYSRGKFVSNAKIAIDDTAFPRKITEAEKRRIQQTADEEKKQSSGPSDLTAVLLQQQQHSERMHAEMQAQSRQMMIAMMQIQENASARLVDMTRALAGGRGEAPGSIASTTTQVLEMAKLLKGFGWGPQGQTTPTDGGLSFGEQVLITPLKTLAERVGDRVGEAIAKAAGPAGEAPPVPARALPQVAPSQDPAGPRFMQKPAPGQEVKMPPGARMITREELQARRETKEPPAAPTVAQAVPEAVKKTT